MGRLLSFYSQQAALIPNRKPYPIRVTPGQYAELCQEAGHEITHLQTSLGQHPVERINCFTRATGHNVILAPRDDVFAEVERDTGIELVSLANSVTSVPDNIACVEVISVGEMVQGMKPGDLAFLDFFDCKQGYILESEELYIAGSDAFKALFDVKNQAIVPMNNYVVTRRANDRMKVALNGTDRVHVPDYLLTEGIAGGNTSEGNTATHVIYEEVVSVGPLTKRPMPNVMTKAEAALLDVLCKTEGGFDWCQYDGVSAEEAEAVNAVRKERSEGRTPDINPGDLVVFCKEIGTKIRVRGEFQHLVPYDNVLAIIEDAKILDTAIRAGKAGTLIKVA